MSFIKKIYKIIIITLTGFIILTIGTYSFKNYIQKDKGIESHTKIVVNKQNLLSDEDQNKKADKTQIYKTDYYTVNIPTTWKPVNESKYEVDFKVDKNIIASIETDPKYSHEKSIESIIANRFGVHAFANSNCTEKDFGTYSMKKVVVGFELSAADQIKGEKQPKDQLHYFFTSNKGTSYVDFYISTNFVNESDADNIAESLVIK
ncbi:hypothetical protein [Anaeromicropila herbilytica]|uniref:Uncharacterized protein n=1 Tax=Anaeromicropila herbilytica TaxID=2785025 RepID=A0A7R7EHV7_9FIRM|nr:hypothetical protein [Anaeromicropila herbilytica]BCN29515.1 hypothetical protein bsdtb5_08100 [Anaeromicropila herbilytica]